MWKFWQSKDGNVAVIAALVILPILMLGGVGIVYSRIASARGEMQTVVDSTVLSSGMDFSNRRAAEQRIAAMINGNSGRDTAQVNISVNQNRLRIDASDRLETPLLSTIGQTHSPIEVSLEVPVPGSDGSTTHHNSTTDFALGACFLVERQRGNSAFPS